MGDLEWAPLLHFPSGHKTLSCKEPNLPFLCLRGEAAGGAPVSHGKVDVTSHTRGECTESQTFGTETPLLAGLTFSRGARLVLRLSSPT